MNNTRKINSGCPECKKSFWFYPSHPKKFCSKSCRSQFHSEKFKCQNCSLHFSLKKSDVRKRKKSNSTPKFCTRKCFNEYWKNNKIQAICLKCNEKFKQTIWESKNYRFCSPECKSNYSEKGTIARSYKNGLGIFHRIGIEAWGNKCFNCESKENIEVHHIDKNRRHNTPENLRPLCRKCHHDVHKGRLSLIT